MEDWQAAGFGLYVHWPFCQSKCPYCDFNSHVAAQIDQRRWAEAYIAEIKRTAALVPGRTLRTIFFGGGTPSLMEPETVEAVIQAALSSWNAANDIEITLEANPGSVEAARFAGYRQAGVNRVSLGVQALNDTDLRRLGRMHSVTEARAALDIAQASFDRVSFDLIYARQDQTLAQWEAELTEALRLSSGHLSLYQLTIEDGTVFGERHARGLLRGLPTEDLGADFFDLTQDLCNAAGMPAYEVSNHAKPGQEARHNLIYWQAGDYAGIGPGAHGRLTRDSVRFPTAAERTPGLWLAAAESPLGVTDMEHALTPEEQAIEYLLMGLRLSSGISLARLSAMLTHPYPATAIDDLESLGLVHVQEDVLSVTAKGRPLLNAVLEKLVGAL
ncbi:oxygen-independent coproporphyrinogen-3 oxidase [Gemmobacter aquatilis]|uniref:Heme chaperone HemW n=1 Tax=Gemmobacter aquatilis TaxID=933059 RepID=A0A1H7YVF0_9RHOB|nr:radical SAM family heme chaperone HemW [Gemmobacter aquatilis]SEM50202.1 oxygen-independent coproporphyrinogen-3 oxidase [Gemmobacter aquatilis]